MLYDGAGHLNSNPDEPNPWEKLEPFKSWGPTPPKDPEAEARINQIRAQIHEEQKGPWWHGALMLLGAVVVFNAAGITAAIVIFQLAKLVSTGEFNP
jgi:hypothetical protein